MPRPPVFGPPTDRQRALGTALFEVLEAGGRIPKGARAESNGHVDLTSFDVPVVLLWVPGAPGEAVGQTIDGLRPINQAAHAMLWMLVRAGEEAKRRIR